MSNTSRRSFLTTCAGGVGLAALECGYSGTVSAAPRQRIIIDNDFAGDPDGLYQTAHHLLSPSVDVRLLIGSHSHEGENWGSGVITTDQHAAKARELVRIVHATRQVPVLAGVQRGLAALGGPTHSASAEAIIAEAMRDADGIPLYYTAGAGLTELANAWLLEPAIGRKIRLVWIGGSEYSGVAQPPGPHEEEYNLTIDIQAAQTIFNRSDIDIWQVPRNVYRQMMIGWAELELRSKKAGALGSFLADNIAQARRLIEQAPPPIGGNPGEAYILGDSPLVTLTALQSPFQPDPSSSAYELRACPTIDDKGRYTPHAAGRLIRVYSQIDARLTFEDMFAKLIADGS